SLDGRGTYWEAVALSPDGKTLAAKRSHVLHLLDAATGAARDKIDLPGANPSTLTGWMAYSPDGKQIAVASATGESINLVDREKRPVGGPSKHATPLSAAAFSPDGKHRVGAGYDYDNEQRTYFARLWEVSSGKDLCRLPAGRGGFRTVTFSPDGALIAGGGD